MRIKKSLVLGIACLFVFVSATSAHGGIDHVHAEDETSSVPSKPPRQEMRKEAMELKKTVKEAKDDLQSQIQEKRDAAKETAATKKDALRTKIAAIADTHKKAVVQRLDTRFETTNQTSTDRWTEALVKMTSLVDRVSSQAADLEASGVDTTTVDASVISARAAILAAETAVASQAGKTYVMPITTDATLRSTVGTTVSQFRLDLKSTHQTLVVAKKAVMDTVRALAVVKKKPVSTTTPPVSTTSAEIEL